MVFSSRGRDYSFVTAQCLPTLRVHSPPLGQSSDGGYALSGLRVSPECADVPPVAQVVSVRLARPPLAYSWRPVHSQEAHGNPARGCQRKDFAADLADSARPIDQRVD